MNKSLTALTDLVARVQGFQEAHRVALADAQAPVEAANQELAAAQAAMMAAQDAAMQATNDAAAVVATENASLAENQKIIDDVNALIVSLGGSAVPNS